MEAESIRVIETCGELYSDDRIACDQIIAILYNNRIIVHRQQKNDEGIEIYLDISFENISLVGKLYTVIGSRIFMQLK